MTACTIRCQDDARNATTIAFLNELIVVIGSTLDHESGISHALPEDIVRAPVGDTVVQSMTGHIQR
ncbi:hypothetical protein D3C71_1313450 [compost metagenome]